MKRISVVIPAASEEGFLERAVGSVRRQEGVEVEVIVVVNGATDRTAEIARRVADKVVEHPQLLGYSMARNAGAARATGDLLLFLDADSEAGEGALLEIARRARPFTFGTVLGRPDIDRLKYHVFFALKNTWHRLKLYHGALGGLMFCDPGLFRAVGGFDAAKEVDEIYDFSLRARRAGGRHLLMTRAHSVTSMRRFERQGLLLTFGFWLRLRFPLLGRGLPEVVPRRYL